MKSGVFFVGLLVVGAGVVLADDPAVAFRQRVKPVLEASCIDCHSGPDAAARFDLSRTPTIAELALQSHDWFKVLGRVEAGTMPPEEVEPLTPDARRALVEWIRGDLATMLFAEQQRTGRSRLRRLSRNEYANTIQDLFGIRPPVRRLMPGDGRVDGYDKVSSAVPFSTAATEGQLAIAELMVERMFAQPKGKATTRLWSIGSEQSKGHVLELPDGWNVSFNTDSTSGPLRKPRPDKPEQRDLFPSARKPGLHRLRMHVYGYQADKPLPVGIYVGHVWAHPQTLELLGVVEVPPGQPAIVEADVYLRTGWNSDLPSDDGIRLIPLGLGVPVPKNTQASQLGTGPGLAIQWVDVEELEETLPGQALLTTGMSDEIREAFRKNATLAAAGIPRETLETFAASSFSRIGGRLFRRELTTSELARSVTSYLEAIDAGGPLQAAFAAEVAALMTAPDFLCIVEQQGRLSDFALASRLAYFLWNSTPDEQLLQLARAEQLSDPAILRAQTERLLNDPKSDRFVNDFLDQWLGLWGIDNTTPDRDLYPEYDDVLKLSSVMETRATFRRMLDENLSVRDFVAPRWAQVNERLARHYGIPGVEGFAIRTVPLPADTPFGGLWTQASTMKVTANGTLTSPVKRGVWFAERLLGTPIPPPPANIDPVDPDTRGAQTLREQLALHSGQGSCAACHAAFDPYGFALESFDVMGNHRISYRVATRQPGKGGPHWQDGLPVDCGGKTPDGLAFTDIRQLRQILAERPEQLAQGVARHLVTYATGEPVTPVDQPAVDRIAEGAAEADFGLRSIIHGVVQSELFRWK